MFNSFFSNKYNELGDTIFRMAYIAEIKEWDNRSHLKRIEGYSRLLALGAGVPGKDATTIALACQLHDVGKSTTPDELLKRKGDYSEIEWYVMEKHTLEGEQILRGSTSVILQIGAMIAATHHERWDGSGYPNKLSGEFIPLGGRICAIADVYDALTTTRSYKESIDDEAALELVRKSSGTLFDPKLVKVFIERYSDILNIKKSSANT